MIIVQESDVEELRSSSSYVSDVLVEFYFNYLSWRYPSDQILFVLPTISFFLANSSNQQDITDCLNSLKLPSNDLIFFPVHKYGSHWSLLVYFRAFNLFSHHDSMRGMNNEEAQKLYLAVKDYVDEEFDRPTKRRRIDGLRGEPELCFVRNSPQQSNGYDCGLYMMATAQAICGWYYKKDADWMKEILDNVDEKVERDMRPRVLELIYQANNGNLGSFSCTIKEKSVSTITTDHQHDDNGAATLLPHEKLIKLENVGEAGSVFCTTEGSSVSSDSGWDDDDDDDDDDYGGGGGADTFKWPLTEAANYFGTLLALMMRGGLGFLYKFAAINWKIMFLIQLFSYKKEEKVN